jgi:hypothetical protein
MFIISYQTKLHYYTARQSISPPFALFDNIIVSFCTKWVDVTQSVISHWMRQCQSNVEREIIVVATNKIIA